MFERPGLRAERGAEGAPGRVEFTARATDIATNAIVEFLVISEESAHDYEALFVSKSSATDLDAALRFVGMLPGRAAYAQPLSFWPRGERVSASLKNADGSLLPLESLVLDRREGRGAEATLPVTGFVYTGSRPAAARSENSPQQNDPAKLAADCEGPCSILSLYNEPTSLLDVPRKAVQDEVYERFLARPAAGVAPGDEVTILLAPEARSKEEGARARDFALAVSERNGTPTLRLSEENTNHQTNETKSAEGGVNHEIHEAHETEGAGSTLCEGGLREVEATVRELVAKRIDPYTTINWGDGVTIGTAVAVAAWLDALDNEDGLRVEAPRIEQPYYRAFLPDAAWRERAGRPSQPLELRFTRDDAGTLRATLVSIREIWPEDGTSLEPTLEPTDVPVPSPSEAAALADGTGNAIPALLVFAPDDATLGEVLPYVRALQTKRPNVYFF